MNYGDGHSLVTGYDNRLRPTTWNVPGVMGWNYSYSDFNENSGRVTFAQSLNDATLDRSYHYDHVGRLNDVHTGAEARAALQGQGATPDGPYSHHYWYDQFGNMAFRVGWGGSFGGYLEQSLSFTNNRLNTNPFSGAPMQYDQAGNLKNDGHQSFAYDATGQQTFASADGGWGAAPSYQDDPIVVGQTTVRAAHIAELRAAINSLRSRLNLSAYNWQTAAGAGDWITANPIIEMRTALDQALGAGSYAAGLASGQPVKAIHIQELRDRVTAAWNAYSTAGISQFYDGDGLRVKKTESGATTWYLRSSVLGGQIVAEVNGNNVWQRGYVYAGSSLMAVQQGGVFWMHEDPVTKSKRVTDSAGNIVSTIELDPWGGETSRSSNAAFQPQRHTSYTRDSNGGDDAMFRRYQSNWTRFAQPDPYDGSYNLGDPQSFNRYAYVQNDLVNLIDPTGLGNQSDEAMFRRYNRWHSRFDQPDPYNDSLQSRRPYLSSRLFPSKSRWARSKSSGVFRFRKKVSARGKSFNSAN